MKRSNLGIALLTAALMISPIPAEKNMPELENPITVEYLKENLRQEHPRLGLTPELEADIKSRLDSDPVLKNMYEAVKLNVDRVLGEPLLERKKTGRRLLSVSRETLWRINVLGFVYRMEKSPEILERIKDELLAVAAFSDWNPSHFLDVAEMSLAVSLGLDWTWGDLSETDFETIQAALIEKGLRTNNGETEINNKENNWNQVCNGGMIAAALTVAEAEPELAAKAISGALDAIPISLSHYAPDGVYPEGSTYWGYGTMFTAMTSTILETSLGTDFGIFDFPGLAKSAMYRVVMTAPTGYYYDYGDCGSRRGRDGDITLGWFASKTGEAAYFEKDLFLQSPEKIGKLDRHAGFGMIWLSQFDSTATSAVPEVWYGRGINPVAIFQGGPDDTRSYYLGCKGGKAQISHGSMDSGSFIFELNGVRWSIDMGNQSYHPLEATGFHLWGRDQDAERWHLLSKNNLGHSTLTINGAHHTVDGPTTLVECTEGPAPSAVYDMTETLGGLVTKATRTFTKDSEASVTITDTVVESDKTETITWQMMTTADVEVVEGGAVLTQDGETLKLENQTHTDIAVSVVSLNPPPHELDKEIDGLKRLEITIPASSAGNEVELRVRLSEG